MAVPFPKLQFLFFRRGVQRGTVENETTACYNGNMAECRSFPPVYAPDARVLILGSMPGEASLKAGQYYAHARNAFWPIMFSLWEEPPAAQYDQKTALLLRRRIALWDVASVCEREGSLDSAIRGAAANDFAWLFAVCSGIHTVFFNGQTAFSMYHRLCGSVGADKRRVRLPSTSPAYTLPFARKLEAWRAVRLAAERGSAEG